MRSEEFRERRLELDGWAVNVVSYRVGDRFYCTIENADPGAREDAESAALNKAREYLKQTRRRPLA